jgi:hypothetical protein
LALGLAACPDAGPEPAVERAEFGVLFGGDIQDRPVLPLRPGPAPEGLGEGLALRVTFARPLEREVEVSWEIERPAGKRAPDGGALYAAEVGHLRAETGARRVDARFHFRPSDPPGTWRARIRVAGRVVYDRSFRVEAEENRRGGR